MSHDSAVAASDAPPSPLAAPPSPSPSPSSEPHEQALRCANCGAPGSDAKPLFKCGRCRMASYCGKLSEAACWLILSLVSSCTTRQTCQAAAWEAGHKSVCRVLAASRVAASPVDSNAQEEFDNFIRRNRGDIIGMAGFGLTMPEPLHATHALVLLLEYRPETRAKFKIVACIVPDRRALKPRVVINRVSEDEATQLFSSVTNVRNRPSTVAERDGMLQNMAQLLT